MDLSIKNWCLLLGCLVIGLVNHPLTEALQCYVCDSCVDGTELEIQICGELPFETTTQSQVASTKPTNITTTPSPLQTGTSSVSTVANSTASTRTSTRRPTTTTRRPATTSRRPTTKEDSDSEENYSDYEESDEDRKRRNAVGIATIDEDFSENASGDHASNKSPLKMHTEKQLMQMEPVCFMVKFRVNNTQFTNLGCTSMVKDNAFLTCKSLNRTDAIMEDCQLCGGNGCNKHFLSDSGSNNDWEYPWFNSGSKMDFKIINLFLIFFLAKLIN